MSSSTLLFTDEAGLTFEYLCSDETEFLYEEIFTRRSYLQHGVQIPQTGSPIVVDIGANIGLFSLLAIRVNRAARVYAVEPLPAAYRCLERNLAMSTGNDASATAAVCSPVLVHESPRTTACTLHCYADAPGESTRYPAERRKQRARLLAHVRGGASGLLTADAAEELEAADGAAEAVRVPAATLSQLLATWGVGSVDLLKIDAEGDELNVLRGLRSADWPKVRQVVLEVHDIYGRLEHTLRLLRRHGFRATAVQQAGSVVDGYDMCVPPSLRLFYVYGTRLAAGEHAQGGRQGLSQGVATTSSSMKKRRR